MRRKGPKGNLPDELKTNPLVQRLANAMTNWQRQAWAKAGYPQDPAKIRPFVNWLKFEEITNE